MGSFATKLWLLFGTLFGASIALLVGGWFGVRTGPPGTPAEYLGLEGNSECALTSGVSGVSNEIEMGGWTGGARPK